MCLPILGTGSPVLIWNDKLLSDLNKALTICIIVERFLLIMDSSSIWVNRAAWPLPLLVLTLNRIVLVRPPVLVIFTS